MQQAWIPVHTPQLCFADLSAIFDALRLCAMLAHAVARVLIKSEISLVARRVPQVRAAQMYAERWDLGPLNILAALLVEHLFWCR